MKFKIGTKTGIKQIEATDAFEIYGHRFVVHKSDSPEPSYSVSEYHSGLRVPCSEGETKAQAIETAKNFIEAHGKSVSLKVFKKMKNTLLEHFNVESLNQ